MVGGEGGSLSQVGRAGASALLCCFALHDAMAPPAAHLLTPNQLPTYLPTTTHSSAHREAPCPKRKMPNSRGERKQLPIQMGNLWQVSPWRWRLWAASCRWRSPHAPDLHSPVFTEQLRHRRRLQPAGEALSHHSTNTGFLQQEKQGIAMSGKA